MLHGDRRSRNSKRKEERKTISERGGGLDPSDFWSMVWLQSFISAEDLAVFAARHVRSVLDLVPMGIKKKGGGRRVWGFVQSGDATFHVYKYAFRER